MTNLSVIILVGKEERHIGRCLEKLASLEPRQIFVVESQKGDRTHEIAVETAKGLGIREQGVGVESPAFCTVWHDWEGTQAKQFNWAVDNLPLEGEWILRLDADEYLTPDTIEKLKQFLSSTSTSHFDSPSDEVAGLTLELKRKFCGGEIRHGTNGIRQVRLFRRGKARYAETLMDERLIIGDWQKVDGEWKCLNTRMPECLNGHNIQTFDNSNIQTLEVEDFPGAFYDDSLMPMSEWREKHRGYAKREAQQAVESMKSGVWVDPRKAKYYKLPPFLRAFIYFGIRYFLKGGILDGYAGWMWNFWQGLWYRCLVDYEIGRLRRGGV